ncbi:agamous-like MADS-box protein AGL90 [Punica granatum]|uniref:Agamous-like MADS-box protein AGL90 n=1 Tax=Punica granatum TaxID=22663 RepID=A0A6P8DKR6_PUNGR|nr:agamous-like MADS-box protein AGL90 [Punica granatum]
MGRGTLALELIGKEKSRRVTFEKGKSSLLKKAKEFSILCGVDTCVLIYGTPAISDRLDVLEIWPPNPDEWKLGTELMKARTSTCKDLIARLSEEEELISLKTLLGHRLESAKKRFEAMKSEKELAALLLQDQTNNIAPNPLMVG